MFNQDDRARPVSGISSHLLFKHGHNTLLQSKPPFADVVLLRENTLLPYTDAGLRDSDKEDEDGDDDEDEEEDAEVIGDVQEGQTIDPIIISAEDSPIASVSEPVDSASVATENPLAPATDENPPSAPTNEDRPTAAP